MRPVSSLRPGRPAATAFSLVEVMLALGVVSFALVLLLGLIMPGLKTNKVSVDEITVVSLASSILVDLRCSPSQDASGAPLTASGRYALPLPLSVLSATTKTVLLAADGTVAAGVAPEPAYQATVNYVPAGQNQNPPGNRPAVVAVTITWPPGAAANTRDSWQGVATFPEDRARWQ